jgi:catechol 2,3-dioxygenase-like lactoylglutathione lyase family enzyme
VDLNHLHLGVDDVEKSAAFYELLGFRNEGVWHGGALFVTNDSGFELAIGPHGRVPMPDWFHIGFKLSAADDVRVLQSKFDTIVASGDDPDFVWFRVADPDSYQVEVYWEG